MHLVPVSRCQVQKYRNEIVVSLLSHHTTKFSVYKADRIPKPPGSAKSALVQGHKRDSLQPTEAVSQYVSYLFHKTDTYYVPDEAEFQQKAAASLNVNTMKFRLLKDVSQDTYCDVIAQVARKPFDGVDKVTLYVSDYTENSAFFHYTWDGVKDIASRATSDPYGYTRPSQDDSDKEKDEWVGPYGQKTIQVTCFEPHASFIRSDVSSGCWLRIRNLRIKLGKDLNYLEGFLHEDKGYPGKINIEVLDTENREMADPRFVEAMHRWREYHREKKRQMKEKANDLQAAQTAGQKRRQSLGVDQEPEKKKTRQQKKKERNRRKAQGQHQAQKIQDQALEVHEEGEDLQLPQLNNSIACESHPGTFISTIGSITAPSHRESGAGGQKLTLPFLCAKYRACVRVINFYPSSLEKFACSRRRKQYEGFFSGAGSDSGAGTSDESMDEDDGRQVWEWRFALQLEDARHPGQRVWTVVDNFNGQCLTGLDASDLTHDQRTLEQLRNRMFLLWGNLEEKKSEANETQKKPVAKKQNLPQLEKPPLDSSDREDNGSCDSWESEVSNLPFMCCIQQYGVCVTRAGSPTDEAAPRQEWTRVFALFGTKISH
jgi:protection of telomeres protein 1